MDRSRCQLLDIGRFVAASAVLCYHYFLNGMVNGKVPSMHALPWVSEFARYGYLGVDFFFLISGYVILLSARDKPAHEFAVSRALRLYPAFLVAVLLTATLAQWWGGSLMSVSARQVAANLTMLAPLFHEPYVDGVYWTLAYEVRFYALVLVALLLGARRRLETLAIAWVVLQLCVQAVGWSRLPLLGGYDVFFAAGCLFAVMQHQRRYTPTMLLLLTGALLLCARVAMLEAEDKSVLDAGLVFSPLVAAAAVVLFFVFFGLLGVPRIAALRIPGSRLMGGLTYPLYLVHAHIGYMLLARFGRDDNRLIVYPVVIGIVLCIALAIHLLVERRLARQWRSFFTFLIGTPLRGLQRA